VTHRNPIPTVDIVIEIGERIVLIQRKNPPFGWALPGGFIDEGETVENAAVRESLEETGLNVALKELMYVYSNPKRDPRKHTISVVFIAQAKGTPKGMDDAKEAKLFHISALPKQFAFDHAEILSDYIAFKRTGRRPQPTNS
jgi:ADP-ribose pyrophosphatase YjhB (NUDIX family)